MLGKRKKMFVSLKDLVTVEPIGMPQKKTFESYNSGKNLFLNGSAGTGKTFILLYLALKDVLTKETPYDKIVLIRSLLPSRDIGFLPGTLEEKSDLYQDPYRVLVKYMFKLADEQDFNQLYDKLKVQGILDFLSTSFLRGQTFDRSIVIVDESENLSFQELDTVITRVGQDSKIMFSGDYSQSDLKSYNGYKKGYFTFSDILQKMEEFSCIEFGIGDIIRSGLVRSYLISKENITID